MGKKIIRISCVISFCVLLLTALSFAECYPPTRLITVTGNSEVKVTPDEIIFSFAASNLETDLNLAKDKTTTVIKSVLDFAKKLGIEQKNIQTDHINITPRYENYYKKSSFLGYACTENVTVVLKDISKFEELLTGVLRLGVTNVNGIQFRTTQLRKYRDEARKLAIKAAKEKAEAMSAELGQKIGRTYSIKEYGSDRWGGSNAQVQMARGSAEGDSEGSSFLAPGQISVNADVEVSFELE
jgi:uncharacterized protein YggE